MSAADDQPEWAFKSSPINGRGAEETGEPGDKRVTWDKPIGDPGSAGVGFLLFIGFFAGVARGLAWIFVKTWWLWMGIVLLGVFIAASDS
jgi:hypothetical protein